MSDAPRPSLEEFTRELEQALRAAGYTGPIVRDPAKGLLGIEGDRALSVVQLYETLAGEPAEIRHERLAKAARTLLEPPALPATWAETALHLRVAVKPQITLVSDELRRQAGAGPADVYVAKITPHLALELAFPVEDGSLSVPRVTLDGWGVTPDVAFAAAGANDATDLHKPWIASSVRPGVLRSPWKDGRDGGRLLWRQVFAALPLHGRPVVMLPSPSTLLVAGSSDATGLGHLADEVLQMLRRTGRHFFLRAMCVSEDGEAWEDWLPPAGHPAYDRFRLLQALQEVRDASEFIERMGELERSKGREVLPLPRLEVVVESHTRSAMTVTTWRSGKPVALPQADAIVLRRGPTLLGIVAWGDLEKTLPGTLSALPGYPPRFLAADFPEDWQLGMLDVRPWTPPRDGPPPGL